MILKKLCLTLTSLIILISCNQKSEKIDKLQKSLDSIVVLSNQLTEEIKDLKKINPKVIISKAEGMYCVIDLFKPYGLNMFLSHSRPDFTADTYMCVPAAYTSTNNTIEGLFIEKGIEINSLVNKNLTGGCIVSENSIQIIDKVDITNEFINQLKQSKKSFFQQSLLVKNGQVVECELFGNKENLRRALIQFEDSYCIGESKRPITIKKFQESLVSIGAINAIYLDMGTWSEGWYKNNCSEKIVIGENMINTKRQTSWLVFKQK